MNVYEKIASVRVKLQNSTLKKSGVNKYAGYDYFQLKDFIPTLNVLMDEVKLFTNFSIVENVATLEIVNCEKPEEKVVFTSPTADANLKGCTPVQCLGGVHTYLHRYLLQNAFNIVEDDMIEKETGNPDKKVAQAPYSTSGKNALGSIDKTDLAKLKKINAYSDIWLQTNMHIDCLEALSYEGGKKLVKLWEDKKGKIEL